MTIEQAIKMCDDLTQIEFEEHELRKYGNKLCSFLKSQQEEIERLQIYERVCPECEGLGMNDVDPEAPTKGKTRCRICKGTGRIPRWRLPDWFVKDVLQEIAVTQQRNNRLHFYLDELDESAILNIYLTKQSDDTWELSGAGAE